MNIYEYKPRNMNVLRRCEPTNNILSHYFGPIYRAAGRSLRGSRINPGLEPHAVTQGHSSTWGSAPILREMERVAETVVGNDMSVSKLMNFAGE